MSKVMDFFKKYWPSKRKWMQLYFALLFNANLKGFISGNIYTGNVTKTVCVPGMNCYSCPGAVGACPLGSLQGSFSADHSTIYYVGGILLLYSILFGRLICGWLCPFGLIQEWLHKIKTPKIKKGPVTRILSYLKYVLLVFFVVIVPVLYALRDTPLPAFCKYICPAGTLEGGMGLLSNKVNDSYFSMLGPIFTWKFLLMVSMLVGCIFVFRLFCRFVCPLGALYGLFNKFSFFGIKLNRDKCVDCNKCVAHCKMDIRHVGDPECISCGECIPVCPTKAIEWKGPKILVKPSETLTPAGATDKKQQNTRLAVRTIAAVAMLAVLIGAIAFFWTDTPPLEKPSTDAGTSDQTLVEGNQIGNLCYGYDLEVVNGNGVTGETVNPAKTGKVTVLNFWGTWCTPCVKELPYFEQIAKDYGDQIAVIAAHGMNTPTAPGYIAQYYPETPLIFANDYIPEGGTVESGYYTTLGGRGTYPYTLVLDENGVITEIFYSSVTYDMLKEAVDKALNIVPSAVEGNQIGDLCYGYDLEIVNGNGVTGETVNPAKTGKVTVLNFWGTWCTPCVKELPYFEQIAKDYGDQIAVIAAHGMNTPTAPGYIAQYYPETPLIFANDYIPEGGTVESGYYTTLGGRGTYPYTLVLDENGVITEIFYSSVTYDMLKEAVDKALQ